MPITPYHLGPNAFVGLLFRPWLDLPTFLLAGLVVDLEVLIYSQISFSSTPLRYCHTLLVAGLMGLALGVILFPLRKLWHWAMTKSGLPYRTSFLKMLMSGLLGAWLHVLIDSLYRTGPGLFWPLASCNPLSRFSRGQTEYLCLLLFFLALFIYMFIRRKRQKGKLDPKSN